MATKYGTLRLKQETINYLKRLKLAYEMYYETPFSNDDFVMKMVEAIEKGDAPVWRTFDKVNKSLDAIMQKAAEERKKAK